MKTNGRLGTIRATSGFRLRPLLALFLFGAVISVGAEPTEQARQSPPSCEDPVGRLTSIPGPLLEEHVGPTVREVLDIVWRGHNGNPHRRPRCRVEIVGQVLIGSDPHEFRLEVRQERGVQTYELQISEYGVLDLEVEPASDGQRIDARYSLIRHGAEPSRGTMVFDDAVPQG